jgi:hypothetical protein
VPREGSKAVLLAAYSGAADSPAAEHIDLVKITFILEQSKLTQFKSRATLKASDLRITSFLPLKEGTIPVTS